jgi:hypothetical protein
MMPLSNSWASRAQPDILLERFTLSALLLSWRLGPARAGFCFPVQKLTLVRFSAPLAHWHGDSTNIRRGYHTRLRSALRFSQPPSAFFFPKPFRPCFMPVTLLGFAPTELFPCRSPIRLSTPAPLLTLPEWPAQRLPRQAMTDDWRSTRPATGVSPSGKAVRRAASVSSLTVADALLVFPPSKGLPRHPMGSPSRVLLSRPCSASWSARRLPSSFHRTSESCSCCRVAGLPRETAVLPGFFSLFTLPALEELARPWLIDSPRVPEYVAVSRRTLYGLCLL